MFLRIICWSNIHQKVNFVLAYLAQKVIACKYLLHALTILFRMNNDFVSLCIEAERERVIRIQYQSKAIKYPLFSILNTIEFPPIAYR